MAEELTRPDWASETTVPERPDWASPAPSEEPAAPEPGWGDIAKDVAKQAASGIVVGTEAIPTLPAQATRFAARLTGAEPEQPTMNRFENYLRSFIPGAVQPEAPAADLGKLIEEQRGGGIAQYLPQPETTAGQYARTVGEFVPGAVTMGTGSILKDILRQAAVPGIASETAGQITAGTEAEPYARAVTAFATGMRGAAASERARAAAARGQLLEDLPGQTKQLYQAFDRAAQGTPVNSQLGLVLRQQMRNELNAAGERVFNSEAAHKAVDDLTGIKDVYDLAKWRQAMRDELYKKGMSNSARILTDAVDRAIEMSMPAGSPGVSLLQRADREFSIRKLIETLDAKVAHAEEGTAATHSGTNLDNKIRQALVSFKANQRAWHGLTPQEQVQLDNIIVGGRMTNALRRTANLLGGGGGMGSLVAGIGGGALFGGFAGAGATVAAGKYMKHLENIRTQRAAENLLGAVAERSAFAPTVGHMQAMPLYQGAVPRALYYGGLAGTMQTTPEGYPYIQAR